MRELTINFKKTKNQYQNIKPQEFSGNLSIF